MWEICGRNEEILGENWWRKFWENCAEMGEFWDIREKIVVA